MGLAHTTTRKENDGNPVDQEPVWLRQRQNLFWIAAAQCNVLAPDTGTPVSEDYHVPPIDDRTLERVNATRAETDDKNALSDWARGAHQEGKGTPFFPS
jgi:hypothetical protein